MRGINRFIFINLLGWSISGDVPSNTNKFLIIVAPHSSNFDFFIGLFVRSILKFKCGFLAKKELFDSPFGFLFKALGGDPVDRSNSHNLVEQVVELIKNKEYFVIAITPEGTRKLVEKWKTGFYYIALKANIPLVLASIDYEKKNVKFSEPILVTGDKASDASVINEFYKTAKGKNHDAAPLVL